MYVVRCFIGYLAIDLLYLLTIAVPAYVMHPEAVSEICTLLPGHLILGPLSDLPQFK